MSHEEGQGLGQAAVKKRVARRANEPQVATLVGEKSK